MPASPELRLRSGAPPDENPRIDRPGSPACGVRLHRTGPARGRPDADPVTDFRSADADRASSSGPAASNSLWRAGASSFFNDARASKIGDILTVEVTIADQAQMANSSTRSRTGSRQAGVTGLLGFENNLDRILPNEVDPENLVGFDSSRNSAGQGQISRNESIRMTVAALVTQVLPNGNFVVAGRQEVRVNGEVRELLVSGIVRPQDVSAANTVRHSQMAEARISYGGRGFITQAQNPPVGQQVLDVLLPF